MESNGARTDIPGSYNQGSYFTEKTEGGDSLLNMLLLYTGIHQV